MSWIKFENNTPDKPEVIMLAATLRLDRFSVVGRLLRLWAWADSHSLNGQSLAVTATFIDELAAKRGFAAALRTVGWLTGEDGALCFPNFDRHNGETAKARAESARRMAKSRATHVAENPQHSSNAGQTSASQKPQPEKRREEKRREIPNTTPTPPPAEGGNPPPVDPKPNRKPKPGFVLPSTQPEAIRLRLLALNHCAPSLRREETQWSGEEFEAARLAGLLDLAPEEFDRQTATVARFMRAPCPPKTEANRDDPLHYRRRDLVTLLRHWTAALDKAEAWCEADDRRRAEALPPQMQATAKNRAENFGETAAPAA